MYTCPHSEADKSLGVMTVFVLAVSAVNPGAKHFYSVKPSTLNHIKKFSRVSNHRCPVLTEFYLNHLSHI